MLELKPCSALFFTLSGVLPIALGIYFIFFRPLLSPEDPQYLGATLSKIKRGIPGILPWLQKVFWVTGGNILTSVLLTSYFATTSFRTRTSGSFTVALLAAISSMGFMTVINFLLQSDFRWPSLALTIPG